MGLHTRGLQVLTGSLCSQCRRHSNGVTSPTSAYVTYLPGTLNLIITAPHGGYRTASHIPDRDVGWRDGDKWVYSHQHYKPPHAKRQRVSTDPDKFTEEMAMLLRDEVYNMMGHYPHLVLCRLMRVKVDVNREKDEGTFGNPEAIRAWTEYHSSIQIAKQAILGSGLLLDIHGHGHELQRTELGYLLLPKALKAGSIDPLQSSIRSLAQRSSLTLSELIAGADSLGGYLEREGFECVPSPSWPTPGPEPYLHGGFTARTHGSRQAGHIDAIQIESPRHFRDPPTLHAYTKALAKACSQYLSVHYTHSFPS